MSRAGEGGGLQNRCRNTTVGPNPTKCSTHHWLNLAEQGTLNAWVEGSKQHQTDEIQKIRDNNKDKLLNENGWNELRIPWSDCCNNTKIWIEKIKLFLS